MGLIIVRTCSFAPQPTIPKVFHEKRTTLSCLLDNSLVESLASMGMTSSGLILAKEKHIDKGSKRQRYIIHIFEGLNKSITGQGCLFQSIVDFSCIEYEFRFD